MNDCFSQGTGGTGTGAASVACEGNVKPAKTSTSFKTGFRAQVRALGGGGTHIMDGRSGAIMEPRISTMPTRSTSGFHLPGRHFLAPRAKRREVQGESHEG